MLKEISNGLGYLNLAEIYTQRLDWLFSGDDGEDSFFERLEEELEKYERKRYGETSWLIYMKEMATQNMFWEVG